MEVGRMKSSRFMGSLLAVDAVGGVCWAAISSVAFRSCAMPLGAEVDEGALVGCFLRRLAIFANCQFFFRSLAHSLTTDSGQRLTLCARVPSSSGS